MKQENRGAVSVSVTDLRIGNYVIYNNKEIGTITEVQAFLFNNGKVAINQRLDIFYHTENIKPIPLTEEWLLKLGFIFNGWNYDFENLRFHAQSKNEKGEFYNTEFYVKKGLEMVLVSFNVKFVHNMQNIYKELRGYELQIGNLTEH